MIIYSNNKHNLSRKTFILSITVVILILLTNITIGDKTLDIQGNKYVQDTDFDDCESTEVIVDKIYYFHHIYQYWYELFTKIGINEW